MNPSDGGKRSERIMLSEFRRFDLVDDRAQPARLVDLAVDLLKNDYPPVTRLIFRRQGEEQKALGWEAVQGIDWSAGKVRVADLAAGEPAPAESLMGAVLLKRDMQDALILDLQHLRTTRANDLQLEQQPDGRLVLRAADVSPLAVLRRLTRGIFGHSPGHALYDWRYVEFLRGDPHAAESGAAYHRRISRLPPGDIAHLSDLIPYLHAAELITLLPDSRAADTLELLASERQVQIFEELREDEAATLLGLMAPEEAADLLGNLDPDAAQHFLDRLPRERAELVIDLLRYPDDSAGGLMTNELVVAPREWTAGEARVRLRDQLQRPDFVHFVYLVDDEQNRRLRGVISLRALLVADDDRRLGDIMNPYLVTLSPLESADQAAYRVIDSHLAAVPVIGQDGKLLGMVTIDAAVGQISPRVRGQQVPKVFSA